MGLNEITPDDEGPQPDNYDELEEAEFRFGTWAEIEEPKLLMQRLDDLGDIITVSFSTTLTITVEEGNETEAHNKAKEASREWAEEKAEAVRGSVSHAKDEDFWFERVVDE